MAAAVLAARHRVECVCVEQLEEFLQFGTQQPPQHADRTRCFLTLCMRIQASLTSALAYFQNWLVGDTFTAIFMLIQTLSIAVSFAWGRCSLSDLAHFSMGALAARAPVRASHLWHLWRAERADCLQGSSSLQSEKRCYDLSGQELCFLKLGSVLLLSDCCKWCVRMLFALLGSLWLSSRSSARLARISGHASSASTL